MTDAHLVATSCLDDVATHILLSQGWDKKDHLSFEEKEVLQKLGEIFLEDLDQGKVRVLYHQKGQWIVNEDVKKSILMIFRLFPTIPMEGAYDKIPGKYHQWSEDTFHKKDFRAVPGGWVRKGAFIDQKAIVMPSFINIGAHIGSRTLIDSFVTVGSCAYVGQNCHISAHVMIGGVLEPLQSLPVIIEDDVFIGAGTIITEGVKISKGAVIGAGVVLTASTPIMDRETKEISYGSIPPYSVVIPGIRYDGSGLGTPCALIIKKVDEKTRQKTSLNDLLRD